MHATDRVRASGRLERKRPARRVDRPKATRCMSPMGLGRVKTFHCGGAALSPVGSQIGAAVALKSVDRVVDKIDEHRIDRRPKASEGRPLERRRRPERDAVALQSRG